MARQNIALTSQGRVFINLDGSGCGNPYTFYNCMKVDSVDKSLGDITSIYCPDPNAYDEFIEVASIKGADSRWTSTLTGRLEIDRKSALEQLLEQGCAFNMQVHYGRCTQPDSFSEFESAIIFEDVRLTSYGLSTLTATSPDERAAIDETAAISIGNIYRVFTPTISEITNGLNIGSNSIFGVGNADARSCGTDCDTRSNGCSIWFVAAYNTAGTVIFYYTTDGGVTWTQVASNITQQHDGGEFLARMLIAGSTTYVSIYDGGTTYVYSIPNSSIVSGTVTPTLIQTLPNYSITDMAESDSYIWLVGGSSTNNEYIAYIEKSTGEFVTLNDGTLFTGTNFFYSVDALDDDNVLIAGFGGTYAYSNSFGIFQTGDNAAVSNIVISNKAKMFTKNNWLIAAGQTLYCTKNAGATWSAVRGYTGTLSMGFYDNIVGYMQDNTGIYRTINSGSSWNQIYTASEVFAQEIVPCPFNPNMFMSAGGNSGTSYVYLGDI